MRQNFLPFHTPDIGDEEIKSVVETLRSGWLTTGLKVQQFERAFAQYLGVPAALAVSSATDAMLIGLAALGIGPGDEVITTPMTFCSTVHVIEHVGAHPILVDVEHDTLNIDPERIVGAITPRTRAVMPVHLYGHPCEMDRILEVADRHNLYVLEDAAHALPAVYKGRTIGTLGTVTAFSFYATKNITTGEGGMLTGNTELLEQCRLWTLHGMNRDAYKRYRAEGTWYYEVIVPGYKCNMTDIQAALGLQQLKKLQSFQRRRRAIVERYQNAFAQYDGLQTPVERPEVQSAWHLYPLRLHPDRLTIDRAQFIAELTRRNIGTSVHFIPVHLHPFYREKYGYKPADFPIAHQAYERLVSLPLYPRMSDQDADDVIDAVVHILQQYCR